MSKRNKLNYVIVNREDAIEVLSDKKEAIDKMQAELNDLRKNMEHVKIYRGIRLNPEEGTGSDVSVTVDGKPLKHRIYHSLTGLNWGYGGSGPADLAISILWDFLGLEPSPSLYQEFKETFVMSWKDEWEITSEEIKFWIYK